ncbi:MAG: DUF4209 domain-containing protein [Armatimonadetes bacterium]|nr:DUF4209 domain-containing protein [Armatimonadota bacterium]
MDSKPDFQSMSPEQLLELSESTTDGLRNNRSSLYKAAAEKYQAADDQENYQNMVYEIRAFDLSTHENSDYRFGCLHGVVFENGDEAVYPDRKKDFPDESIEYYKTRAIATSNPILKARYADVVWDFRPFKHHEYALLAADAYLDCTDVYIPSIQINNLWGLELADAVERALCIAVKLNNDQLINTIAEEAITHYSENEVDSFNDQRSFLEVIADIHKLEGCADQAHNTKRRIAEAFEAEAIWKSVNYPNGHLVAIGILEKALKAYVELGDAPEKAEELKIAIASEHVAAQGEYKRVESMVRISQGDINNWLDPYRAVTIENALLLLAGDPNILPSYENAYKSAVDQAKEFVFMHMIPMELHRNGMTVKRIEGEEEKLAYSAAVNFRRHYRFAAEFLLPSLFKLLKEKDKCYLEVVHQYIATSGVFELNRVALINVGFDAFERADYIACMHILTPQIEGALRDFLGLLGASKTSFNGVGDWEAQLLSRVLSVLEGNGFESDFVWLMRLFLADKLGDNLRNEVAHGLADPGQFTWANSAMMLYILIKLATYRISTKTPAADSTEESNGDEQ